MNERVYINAVLDEIKAEIEKLDRFELRGETTPLINADRVLDIINEYRKEQE